MWYYLSTFRSLIKFTSRAGNMRILKALRGVESRRTALGREANRLIREDPKRDAVELNYMLQDWMDTKMPVFSESEYSTLGGPQTQTPRRPGQKPSRPDPSVPGEGRRRAEGLGDRLQSYGSPQAPVPPGPGAAATHPAALPSNNPFVLTSPHTNQPIDLSSFSDNFPPSGTLMKDPTAPNKFFRIP